MEVEGSAPIRNLPAELWREIFEKIPKKERGNIPQVNSFFYKIICDMEALQRVLVVRQEDLNKGIEMLLWSKRKIKKINFQDIEIDPGNLTLMMKILEVHGATVETMDISKRNPFVQRSISTYQFIKFFQLTPKLKKLDWSIYNVKLIRWYNENVLPELKVLNLSCSPDLDFGFSTIFTPGTIEELIVNTNWLHLESLVCRQTAIKKLIINCEIKNMEIFNCLKLKHSKLQDEEEAQKLMVFHPELEELLNDGGDVTSSKMIRAYSRMKFLKFIDLFITEENINEIHHISNIENLTNISLFLELEESSQFLQVTTIKLDHVEKVKIEDTGYVVLKNIHLLETAGINWPKVKELDVNVPTNFNGGILLLNEYFDNFKNLEKLFIRSDPDVELDDLDMDLRGELLQNTCSYQTYFQQYPNIKWLEIHDANITHFCDLVSALPNLKHLKVNYEYGIDYTPHCLQELSELIKLKNLKLAFSTNSRKNFSEQEAGWLKKLCHRLRKFEIQFVGTTEFYTTLQNQIRDCAFIEAELLEEDEDQNSSLKLTKVKY